MTSPRIAVLAGLGGVALGFALSVAVQSETGSDAPDALPGALPDALPAERRGAEIESNAELAADREAEARGALPQGEPARGSAASADRAELSETGSTFFSAEMIAWAQREMRAAWKTRRADDMPGSDVARGMEQFRTEVETLPASIGERLAAERIRLEAAREHGAAFEQLQQLENEESGPAFEVIDDRAAFDEFFRPQSGGGVIDGARIVGRADDAVADGVVLTFGPGIHRLRNLTRDKSPYPRDVTVRGAGMNTTLIVWDGDIDSRAPLVNFAIEDCTMHASSYVTDLRSQPAVIRFTRVRFCGFDMGAGGSVALATDKLALHAIDCRFDGGYGRSPGSGNLLRSKAAGFLARFERCTFSRIRSGRVDPHATVVFDGCRFEEMLDDPQRSLPAARFDGCTFGRFSGTRNALGRSLTELFPGYDPDRDR